MTFTEHTETETAIYFVQDDILHLVYKKGLSITLEHVHEHFRVRKEFQKGRKFLILADVSEVWDYSGEAKEFAASKEVSELAIAQAIITGKSLPNIMLANFFINVNKPNVQTKLFGNKEKALDWLENLKKKSPQKDTLRTSIKD